jgi:hypothetical protein
MPTVRPDVDSGAIGNRGRICAVRGCALRALTTPVRSLNKQRSRLAVARYSIAKGLTHAAGVARRTASGFVGVRYVFESASVITLWGGGGWLPIEAAISGTLHLPNAHSAQKRADRSNR